MTTPLVQAVTVQTLHFGSTGGIQRLSSAVIQTVISGHVKFAKVDALTIQTILSSTPEFAKVDGLTVQVLTQGTTENARVASNTAQVIWTIGAPDMIRQRAWTFDLDGHTFYCLDLNTDGTLVFDVTTGKWSRFDTAGYEGHWNMKNGFHWRTGNKVVAGQMETPVILELDTTSFLDEEWRPVVYEARGVIFATDVSYHRQFNLRLQGSRGKHTDTIAPTLSMQYSDDNGVSWSVERSVTLTSDARERIEFRSMGAFTAPGRIFRLYDTGGIKFIAYVTAEVEGAED